MAIEGVIWDDEEPAVAAQGGVIWEDEEPAQPAPVQQAPKQQGFFPRSLDRLRLGASDAISTAMGETYGREGDPTQQDTYGYAPNDITGQAEKLQRIVGKDVLPALGDVGFEAALNIGKAVLPKAAEDAIGNAVKSVATSSPVQALGKTMGAFSERFPEQAASIGEIANIATMGAPRLRVDPSFGRKSRGKLKEAIKADRTKQTARILEPSEMVAEGGLIQSPKGIRRTTYNPSDNELKRFKVTEEAKDFDPRQSATYNMNKVEDAVDELRIDLDKRLVDAPDIDTLGVEQRLEKAIAEVAELPTLVGDTEKQAKKIYEKYSKILRSKVDEAAETISPKELLDTRRELDKWLKRNNSSFFDAKSEGATQLATRAIRKAINESVEAGAPSAEVLKSLSKQSDLLTSRDHLSAMAWKEARTGPGRMVEQLERTTGIVPPRSPLALKSNVSSLPVVLGTGAAALTLGAAQKGAKLGRRANTNIQEMMATALREGASGAQKSAYLELLNQDEEENR